MPTGTHEQGKRIALVALAVICAWLVYRNLLTPARQSLSTPLSKSGSAVSQSASVRQREDLVRSVAPQPQTEAGRRDGTMTQRELAALDPTLRLDLLEKSRKVQYGGNSRNIFQFYTPPPPKPISNPLIAPSSQPVQRPSSPTVNIPLKFYGVASRPGSPEKKAFLTDGDDIYVGQEGDTIDKNYKITRIGVNSIELEDIRTKQRGQLPLIQE